MKRTPTFDPADARATGCTRNEDDHHGERGQVSASIPTLAAETAPPRGGGCMESREAISGPCCEFHNSLLGPCRADLNDVCCDCCPTLDDHPLQETYPGSGIYE